jgi:hypothetical protein
MGSRPSKTVRVMTSYNTDLVLLSLAGGECMVTESIADIFREINFDYTDNLLAFQSIVGLLDRLRSNASYFKMKVSNSSWVDVRLTSSEGYDFERRFLK